MFYLTTYSSHFIYGYMASDIWLRTILIVRKETLCRHIGYSYRLTARVLLYAPSHRQDSTYHGLCYTQWVHLMNDRSDDPSHHERTLYLWATSRSGSFITWNVCRVLVYFRTGQKIGLRSWARRPLYHYGQTIRYRSAWHVCNSFKSLGRKETFYLTWRKEGNVLFNDALNTFYLRLYGVRHMVKDHSDSERGNPLPPHGLLFLISSKGSFICTIPQTG